MSYIIVPLKHEASVNAVRLPAMSCVLYKTYEEALEEAEKFATKHNRQYYVLYIECVASKDTIVAVNEF